MDRDWRCPEGEIDRGARRRHLGDCRVKTRKKPGLRASFRTVGAAKLAGSIVWPFPGAVITSCAPRASKWTSFRRPRRRRRATARTPQGRGLKGHSSSWTAAGSVTPPGSTYASRPVRLLHTSAPVQHVLHPNSRRPRKTAPESDGSPAHRSGPHKEATGRTRAPCTDTSRSPGGCLCARGTAVAGSCT